MRQRRAQSLSIPPTGRIPTAVTHPKESSVGQANRLPGEVSTAVDLPSKDSAWWVVIVQKNIEKFREKVPAAVTSPSEDSAGQPNRPPGKNVHGKVPTAVTNPSVRSGGQTNRLPGKASTAVTLRSEYYTGRAIVQKNTVQELRPEVATAVYHPSEDFEGRVVAGT